MLKKLSAALVLVMFVAIGCGGPGKKAPAEKQVSFPETRFLTAQGAGETEPEARRRALAALSAIFEAKVHSETTSFARSAMGPDNNERFEKTVESTIAVMSTVQLKGARIGRVWQTSDPGAPYRALAIINRTRAGQDWAAEMETTAAETDARIKALAQTRGRFQRVTLLNRILSGVLRTQALESRLRVLNYPARSPLNVDIAPITAELVQLRAQLHLFVELSGENGRAAADHIAAVLTDNGFLLSDTTDDADALVKGTIETYPLELNNPRANFVRAAAVVQVIETGTGATVITLKEHVRKGHVDPNEASRRAVLTLAGVVADQLVARIGFGAPAHK